MLVDHDCRYVELAEPGTECDAALPAADHQHVRLLLVPELASLAFASFEP